MKGWRLAGAMGLLALLVMPNYVPAAITHDASLQWQTLRSSHFTLHYHQHGEGAAREVLAMAEGVHQRLAPLMAWSPREATEIVLSDESDQSNGWATPYPDNRITLFLSAPDALDGLEDHAGWLELVFTHEYLHILHLDKARGSPEALRDIFGRFILLFPNALQPAWFTEGLATRVETDRARGVGRGQSSYYDMLMRMEVAGGLKPLRQVNQPLASWPMGDVPYLYGVHFYDWLAQQYGEEKISALVENYSDNLVPFRIGSNARQVTGKDLDTLWNEFSSAMQAHYETELDAIAARGLSESQRLTRDGYFTGSLTPGNHQDLFYAGFDALHRPALMRLRGERSERLAELASEARLAFHPQQLLLVAQPEVCRNAALYYDLYRFDENGHQRKRLTHCARYRTAVWSPDGQSILAVHNENGYNELHLLDGTGKLQKRLWRGEQREVIGALDWSLQSNTIAASLWLPGQGWELALFDRESAQWRVLTHTPAIEQQVKFTPDGQRLLYSADYDGVYNIHTLDIATGEIATFTNVAGGAFAPVVMGEQLLYAGYDASGFDLYSQPFAPRQEQLTIAQGSGAIAAPPSAPVTLSEPSDYSPLESVRPRWWFPHMMIDDARSELGVVTGGSDTLERHRYALDLAWDAKNRWGAGSIDYIYDRWTTIFKLHADRTSDVTLDSNAELIKLRRESAVVAELVWPLRRYYSEWAVHLGAVDERSSDAILRQGALAAPSLRDRVAGVAITYASASEMPRAVSRSDGRELMLVAEDSDALAGSDYSGRALLFDWKEFLRLGGAHVLALRGIGAKGDDGIRPYHLGGASKMNALPLWFDTSTLNAPFNRRDFALRGYPEGLPQLTGTQLRMASAEYRFPLLRVERGFMAPPVGLHQLHGALFIDSGAAWLQGDAPDRYYTGYGAELHADTVLFYSMLLRLTAGYAHGIDEHIGENQFYLRLGGAF